MITGFEDITHELTEFEEEYVLIFVKNFNKRIGVRNAITAKKITDIYKKQGIKLQGARIRKIINYIRRNKLVINLIATSKGYYVETDYNKVLEYKESLMQRAKEIIRVANTY